MVTSLARPGEKITGLSFQTGELSGKWLDLLKEVLPKLSRVTVLWDTSSTAGQLSTVEASARSMGLQLEISKVSALSDLDSAFQDARNNARKAQSFWRHPQELLMAALNACITVGYVAGAAVNGIT